MPAAVVGIAAAPPASSPSGPRQAHQEVQRTGQVLSLEEGGRFFLLQGGWRRGRGCWVLFFSGGWGGCHGWGGGTWNWGRFLSYQKWRKGSLLSEGGSVFLFLRSGGGGGPLPVEGVWFSEGGWGPLPVEGGRFSEGGWGPLPVEGGIVL